MLGEGRGRGPRPFWACRHLWNYDTAWWTQPQNGCHKIAMVKVEWGVQFSPPYLLYQPQAETFSCLLNTFSPCSGRARPLKPFMAGCLLWRDSKFCERGVESWLAEQRVWEWMKWSPQKCSAFHSNFVSKKANARAGSVCDKCVFPKG